MVLEEFPNYLDWLGSAAGLFGLLLVAAAVLGIFFGYVVTSFRHGPFEAFYIVAQVIGEAIPDFLGTSPRRIMAMARLAIKEALRRRIILVTFGIFAAMLLFGGWFMSSGSDHPDRIYVNFVYFGTQMLILLMGLLLSSFSLPEDIKNKTIYTVVTKPVRSTEIVIGRIVGFGLLGTALLVAMGLISFFFVWRGLSHTHQLADTNLQNISAFEPVDRNTQLSRRGRRLSENAIMEAETTDDSGHNHVIELIEDIRKSNEAQPRDMTNVLKQVKLPNDAIAYHRLICQPNSGHTHRITVEGEGDDQRIRIGPATGFFRARVPVYGSSLLFHDREGKPKETGISVGKEWSYRGYVDGGSILSQTSLSQAIFDFDNITPQRFGNPELLLPIEMQLSVFRTYKGDIEKRVNAGIQFESIPDNPDADNGFISDEIVFETREFQLQTLPVPIQLKGRIVQPDGTELERGTYDLFESFASNGNLRMNLRCKDRNQYLGVAQADVYFRAQDHVYWFNFLKGYLGIWCQMMIVISLGVAFSTFLSTPITMLGSVVTIIIGCFTTFIRTMGQEEVAGGGPIESLFRLVTQKNMTTDLDTSVATTLMENGDILMMKSMYALTYLAPDFSKLNFSEYLTYGYAIDNHRMLVAITLTFAFCAGLTVLGYFCLKTREIAK